MEDGSLIQLCDAHIEYNDSEIVEIFTLENRAEFTDNLKQYIPENVRVKYSSIICLQF